MILLEDRSQFIALWDVGVVHWARICASPASQVYFVDQ